MYILLCPRIKHSHVSSAIINWPRDWTAEKFIFINFRFFNIKPIHPPPAVAGAVALSPLVSCLVPVGTPMIGKTMLITTALHPRNMAKWRNSTMTVEYTA